MKFSLSLFAIGTAVVVSGCVHHTAKPSETSTTSKASGPPLTAPGTRLGTTDAEGYTFIFDGTWDGWRVSENPKAWKIVNGAFLANGDRSHNYYVGPLQPFKDFEVRLDVMTAPGANGGVYVHTKFQDAGWPWGGYEIQVNNSQSDWRRTGSVYAVKDVRETPARDNEWWDYRIRVQGDTIQVFVDGKLVNEFQEEAGREIGKDFERKLNAGTIALQAHDPGSFVYYKNIRVKKLD
ncbi:MAG: DUF1080 domain-containing protein [Verrucomicrobiae bacterium]|nr:DUF1080 domain-containing protein [Verrucomicrobiae bacterium]